MKHVTLTEMRNHRFRRAYHRARRETNEKCISRLVDHVMAQPVERGFFVSADHAIVMDRRRREGTLPLMSAERAAMWREIFAQMDEYLAAHPGGARTDAAAHVIAHGKASKFYINRAVAVGLAVNE